MKHPGIRIQYIAVADGAGVMVAGGGRAHPPSHARGAPIADACLGGGVLLALVHGAVGH
jgi:hypothetical protein